MELPKRKEKIEKSAYKRIRSQTQFLQNHHQANLIRLMTENIANQKANNAITIKSIRIAQNRTR